MSSTSRAALRGRPGLVGGSLAVLVLAIDQLLAPVSAYDIAVVLLVAGVVAGVWGRGDAAIAGVATGVAGGGVLLGSVVLDATPWGVLPLVVLVLVLGFVGWLQWVSSRGRAAGE